MSGSTVSRSRVIAAFAAVYLIWGSTYLGIRFAIETIPPFLMGGVRFMIAGAVLYLWVRLRESERPQPIHWRNAAIIGGGLILGGNGAVVWAEQVVPSGITALLVAILPLWIVLIEWLGPGHRRPSLGVAVGLVVGIIGIVVLIGPAALQPSSTGGFGILAGALVLNIGSLSWAFGSIFSRHATIRPASTTCGVPSASIRTRTSRAPHTSKRSASTRSGPSSIATCAIAARSSPTRRNAPRCCAAAPRSTGRRCRIAPA